MLFSYISNNGTFVKYPDTQKPTLVGFFAGAGQPPRRAVAAGERYFLKRGSRHQGDGFSFGTLSAVPCVSGFRPQSKHRQKRCFRVGQRR